MPSPELFLIFTRKLNDLGLPYMVSGSIAAIFYGEPGRSPKHLRDIQGILVGLGSDWSRDTLERLVQTHGLAAEWTEAQTYAV